MVEGLARPMGITVYFEHVLECFFFRKVNFKIQLVLEFENNTILKMIEKDSMVQFLANQILHFHIFYQYKFLECYHYF